MVNLSKIDWAQYSEPSKYDWPEVKHRVSLL